MNNMKWITTVLFLSIMVSCESDVNDTIESDKQLTMESVEPSSINLYDLGVYVTDIEESTHFYKTVFGLEVVNEWHSIDLSYDDSNYVTGNLHGLYLSGDNGMHLELIEKGDSTQRQTIQQPINHFAIKVDDVKSVYSKALSLGAKPAFEDDRLQYARIGNFKVLNTQIIGLDGERIQILEVLSE